MKNKTIRQKIRELDYQINNNGYTARTIFKNSMRNLKSKNIFNTTSKNNRISNIITNDNSSKICTQLTHISNNDHTIKSMQTSKIVKKPKFTNSIESINPVLIRKKATKRLKKFNPDNEKFICQLLLKLKKTNFNKINFNKLRNYIIKSQNTFNKNFELYYYVNVNNENEDIYQIKKLEDLIAKYSIIIYSLVKVKFEEAKTLFLLMIKENEKYIDLFEYKIYKTFSKEKRINLLNTYPKTAIPLIKIFSIIIKYSTIFNKTRHRNIFLFRYLSLHSLNYRIFRNKCQMSGFTTETKNNIKYWFSLGLHYATHFTLYHYISLKIPIVLSELILKVFKNADESILNSLEKSILVNTSYNKSLLIYVNGHSEQSLKSLEATKQIIISFYDEESIPSKKNNNNVFNNTSGNIHSGKITLRNSLNYGKNKLKRGLFLNIGKKHLNNTFATPENIIKEFDKIISNTNRKNNIRMDNINSLFSIEHQKNPDNNYSITENSPDNLKKFKNEFEVGSNSIENVLYKKDSEVDIRPLFDLNNIDIPNYMKNPLLIKIELLMCEIEIDKKNFNAAYEHIKTSIIIMFILKNVGENKVYDDFKKEIRIMITYLGQIEQLNDIKIKKKQKIKFQKTKKNRSSKTVYSNYLLINDNIDNSFNQNHIACSNYSIPKISLNQFENNNKKESNNEFLVEEIEKLFIFLNSLSMYQIKLLNDFQPKTKNKNDLPILFHNYFKDSLSASQRVAFEKLHTMTLSRYMILEDPDKPILPNNLKFEIINKKFINHFNINKISKEDDDIYSSSSSEMEEDFNIAGKRKENEIFQRILLSENNNLDLRKFLFKNYYYVIKIVKESNDKEIEKIIEDPYIIAEPIKKYLKNNKIDKKYSISINRQCFKINEFNYLFRNSVIEQKLGNRLSKKTGRKRMKSSFYTIDDFCFQNKDVKKREKSRKYTYKKN